MKKEGAKKLNLSKVKIANLNQVGIIRKSQGDTWDTSDTLTIKTWRFNNHIN